MKVRRLIIVRRGDTTLFEELRRRFGDDPWILVMYDRRVAPRVSQLPTQGAAESRPHDERRWPEDGQALSKRGFYVSRECRQR
jgi:hypothetical protein